MNDTPPPIFSAVFLWPKLFEMAIHRDDYDPVSRPSNAYHDFTFELDELVSWINDRWCPDITHKSIQKRWIEDGLQFLKEAGLTKHGTDNSDLMTVRLQRAIGSKANENKGDWPNQDIAKDLADRHTANLVKCNKSRSSTDNTRQTSLQFD